MNGTRADLVVLDELAPHGLARRSRWGNRVGRPQLRTARLAGNPVVLTERDEARLQILRRVNVFILSRSSRRWPHVPARLLGSRQIQQAVCIARRNRLVRPELLELAGFR